MTYCYGNGGSGRSKSGAIGCQVRGNLQEFKASSLFIIRNHDPDKLGLSKLQSEKVGFLLYN